MTLDEPGELGKNLGVELLDKVDPGGAAGSEHGEGAAVLDATDEFGSLLNSGEIGTEVDIEDVVEAELAESSNKLAGGEGTRGETEGLADGNTDGGCGGGNHNLALLLQDEKGYKEQSIKQFTSL